MRSKQNAIGLLTDSLGELWLPRTIPASLVDGPIIVNPENPETEPSDPVDPIDEDPEEVDTENP